jgi:hypothetical protein
LEKYFALSFEVVIFFFQKDLTFKLLFIMYENGRMRSMELFQERVAGRIKEKDGGGEFIYDIL